MTRDVAGRPLRVMHLVPELRTGGMEQGIVKLLNGLAPERVAGALCAFDSSMDSIREQLKPGVAVHALGRRRGNDPMLVYRLVRLLREHRPDIVHSHSWGTLCEGFIAARLARVPRFIHGEHGTMDLRPRNILAQRLVWKRADAVLSVSSKLADKMAREVQFQRDRIFVIRNGADLSRFGTYGRADVRASLGIGDDTLVLGTVGRLVPVKDHDTLLLTFALLKDFGLSFVALIAGEGPERRSLEERTRMLRLDGVVRFLGHQEDTASVLAGMDMFLLTSLSEGLPNAILEAMASGLPIVATQVGGVDELVDEGATGLLAPARDVRRLAGAVHRLATDPALRGRMAAAGQAKARAEFQLERMLNDYECFYTKLTGRAMEADCAALRAAS